MATTLKSGDTEYSKMLELGELVGSDCRDIEADASLQEGLFIEKTKSLLGP